MQVRPDGDGRRRTDVIVLISSRRLIPYLSGTAYQFDQGMEDGIHDRL
jgi:hypothetical protein